MKFETEEEAITWVDMNIPMLIKPVSKNAKTNLLSPFTSGNAYNIVCEELGKRLFEMLNK